MADVNCFTFYGTFKKWNLSNECRNIKYPEVFETLHTKDKQQTMALTLKVPINNNCNNKLSLAHQPYT